MLRASVLLIAALSFTMPCPGQSAPERALLQMANQSRARYGLALLHWDSALAGAARAHLQWVLWQPASLEHQYPGEPDLPARASRSGAHFTSVAENLGGHGTGVAQIHQGWMSSPTHRTNLLDPDLNTVGVAVAEVHGLLYAVEDFTRAPSPMSREDLEVRISQILVRRGVAVSSANGDARRTCDEPTVTFGAPKLVIQWDGPDPTELPAVLQQQMAAARYRTAEVGVCAGQQPANQAFTTWHVAVLLY